MSGVLSHEEILGLIARCREGDEAAREEMVASNIALVKSLVRGFLGRGTEYEDLVQIGSIGLLKAIDHYDPAFGVRFSTYAVPMIAGEIKRFLRDDGIIKVSRSIKENAVRIYKATEAFKLRENREPTIEELAKETDMDSADIVLALEAAREPVSLQEPAFAEGEGERMDMIAKDDGTDMIDKLMLRELIEGLEPRERKIVLLRFYGDKTQSQIAQRIGVSQVQVSRILARAIDKLREAAR